MENCAGPKHDIAEESRSYSTVASPYVAEAISRKIPNVTLLSYIAQAGRDVEVQSELAPA